MRIIIALWAFPLLVFWGWYFLSFYDMNFGFLMLTRQVHDFVFQLYGEILGIDPATIPPMLAKACVFDSLILAAILAFRRRKQIAARVKVWRERYLGEAAQPSA